MGTKSNINFLGKGPKEALFQGQIDIDGLVRSVSQGSKSSYQRQKELEVT